MSLPTRAPTVAAEGACAVSDTSVYLPMIIASLLPVSCAYMRMWRLRKLEDAEDHCHSNLTTRVMCHHPVLMLVSVYAVVFLLGMSAFFDGCMVARRVGESVGHESSGCLGCRGMCQYAMPVPVYSGQ